METNLGKIEGTVSLKGSPLNEGTIGFIPEKGRPAYGKIVDGKILDVTTTTTGDGVALGPCKVQIQPAASKDMYAKVKSQIPEKYQNPAKSNLTATIESGVNKVAFDLK